MLTITEAALRPAPQVGQETARLAAHGVRGMLIPPDFEERFYLQGNLPEQLRRLFAPLHPARLDEDLLENLCTRAQQLVRTTYLLDDAVQVFYRALHNAGLNQGELHVRRPDTIHAEAACVTPPGVAALHAVKRLWAHDWAFHNVLKRVDETGGIGVDARATLLLPGTPGQPDAQRAAELGVPAALVNESGLVGLP